MAVVVGYFDTEDAATTAMDKLMSSAGFEDVETRVYTSGTSDSSVPGAVIGGLPNTSGGLGSSNIAPVPVTGWRGADWLDDLDDEERRYFSDAMSDGRGVLAMARVDEDEVEQVRRLFSQLGARTFADR